MAGGLRAALERAQRLGFLGPGPLDEQLAHADAFIALLGSPSDSFLDLGSGGGLPGLALALAWPAAHGMLLDANHRRGAHLERACAELGIADRVDVLVGRAEDAAHDTRWRGEFPLVVARAFGPPAVTAECAVGFLRPGGRVAVSEPPGGDPSRWPAEGLARLGLVGPEILAGPEASIAVLRRADALEPRWPRRQGVPGRRPLWR
ncbi:MAG TPA: RsmG family class I SAM-dependent methyltransferase [Acidimicrobiia bacterium]|nr:RsmG family class I SAM-dependent methyltransferase [Acidimicrobiia bacterium]